jgi:excisionase family DNA binding protein
MTEYISVKQMAERLNISTDTAYEMVHSAGFPAIKINRTIRIPVDKLEKWLEKRMVRQAQAIR